MEYAENGKGELEEIEEIREINGLDYKVVDIKNDSVWRYVDEIQANDGEVLGYRVTRNIAYYSRRYQKLVCVKEGDRSDGATYAKDINSFGWLFHDELKAERTFSHGSYCSNLQASFVLHDILKIEDRWFRSKSWYLGTLVFGFFKGLME